MAVFPRPSRPSVVWADLKLFFSTRRPHQWVFATLAVACPVLIILGFVHDSHFEREYHRQVRYVDSWSADRTPEEIRAQQMAYDKVDKERQAELERRREPFRKLDAQLNAMGI